MTSLFTVAAEYRQTAIQLEDMDLDAQTIADTLEGMAGDFEDKALAVAAVIRGLEHDAAGIKAAEADMRARREALERRAKSMRDYLLGAMQYTGVKKIACPQYVISTAKTPCAVVIKDAALLPAEMMRIPEPKPAEPDKKAIAAAINAGHVVPGAELVAGERLQIK